MPPEGASPGGNRRPVGHDDLTDAPNFGTKFGWRRPCPRCGVPSPVPAEADAYALPPYKKSAVLSDGALPFFRYRMPFKIPLPSLRAERSLRATVPMPKRRQSWPRSWMEASSWYQTALPPLGRR